MAAACGGGEDRYTGFVLTMRDHDDDDDDDDDEGILAAAMALAGRRAVVVTGAGVSTDSGIPDYRGPKTRERARNPVRFDEFTASPHARKRYWARAFAGWPRIRDAVPNAAHDGVAALITAGRALGCITQNVDGLHQRAGATGVVELHGALREVVCLRCARTIDRDDLQRELAARNPGRHDGGAVVDATGAAPDGDVDLDDAAIDRFVVVDCACGGPLKPAVVFFGENVAKPVLADAQALMARAEALLVLGTSLEVWSGRRFVEAAHQRRLPIVMVTQGATRADHLATVRIDANVGDVLRRLG